MARPMKRRRWKKNCPKGIVPREIRRALRKGNK
jgi:hypothetical protein